MKNFIELDLLEMSPNDLLTIDGGSDPTTDYYYGKGRCFIQNVKGFFSELFS